MQHHWSFWHCASLSPSVVGMLHRLCHWRASSAIDSFEIVAIAFYCSSVLDPKQCLSNENLPMRCGNISLAKLLFSKSGFCVNINSFIYKESISANISSSYFNVICKNMYFFLVPIWRGARSFRSCLMSYIFPAMVSTYTNGILVWLLFSCTPIA